MKKSLLLLSCLTSTLMGMQIKEPSAPHQQLYKDIPITPEFVTETFRQLQEEKIEAIEKKQLEKEQKELDNKNKKASHLMRWNDKQSLDFAWKLINNYDQCQNPNNPTKILLEEINKSTLTDSADVLYSLYTQQEVEGSKITQACALMVEKIKTERINKKHAEEKRLQEHQAKEELREQHKKDCLNCCNQCGSTINNCCEQTINCCCIVTCCLPKFCCDCLESGAHGCLTCKKSCTNSCNECGNTCFAVCCYPCIIGLIFCRCIPIMPPLG